MTKEKTKLKLGWINYLNVLPFKTELKKRHPNIEFIGGHPSKINQILRSKELKLAACSSVNLLGEEKMNIAFPIGLAAKGEVYSVYLGFKESQKHHYDFIKNKTEQLKNLSRELFKKEASLSSNFVQSFWDLSAKIPYPDPNLAPNLQLSKASATSSALAKILYRFVYGEKAYGMNLGRIGARVTDKPCIELLIGDEALSKYKNYPYKVDLGLWWAKLSALPFVYSLWLTNDLALSKSLKSTFLEAATMAQTKMKIEPSDYTDVAYSFSASSLDSKSAVPLAKYWKNLYYTLGPNDFKSLNFYIALVKDLTTQNVHPSVFDKIVRLSHPEIGSLSG